MSKRLYCKQKYEEDEKAAAHVFQDFIKTFHSNTTHANKVFIKSVTLNATTDTEANLERGRLYKPKPIIAQCSTSATKKALECAKLLRDDSRLKSSKGIEKPKSNLDSLKEELKLRHSERVLRKNINGAEIIKPSSSISTNVPLDDICMREIALDEIGMPCRTTNLFINNLRSTITENELMVLFGEYGPLASVKIMWPRSNITGNGSNTDEDDRRGSANCGFVAFMSRKDSERALEQMTNNTDMRISWGRPVELPTFPVYIPPRYQRILMPLLITGYPFNAQPRKPRSIKTIHQIGDMQNILYHSRIMVTMPFDKKQISTIHRMVEFVVREGPLFEAMIMNREMKNPLFEFLFENKSPAHAYYRWKLYSVTHGESTTNWSKKEFRMYKGGAVWVPPIVPNFTQGMPDYLCENNGHPVTSDLSLAQETRLIQFIQGMRMTQQSIHDVTVYCLNHASASRPVVDIVCTSLLNPTTNPTYKIARLYLLSDILHNVWRGKNSHQFLSAFERYMDEIFSSLEAAYWSLRLVHDKIQFKSRVHRVLMVWTRWSLFTGNRISKWEQQFEDKTDTEEENEQDTLDGPMDGQRLRELSKTNAIDVAYDGVEIAYMECPIDEPKHSEPRHIDFVTSKWEAVDPTEIEANAMSTKRLFALENNRLEEEKSNLEKNLTTKRSSMKSKIRSTSESLRAKLRHIEVQVLHFQDDLESGKVRPKRSRKPDEEVLNYRRKLMKKLALESKGEILIS